MNTHTSKATIGILIRTPKEKIPIGVPIRAEDGALLLEVKSGHRLETISLEWLIRAWTRMYS